MLACAACRKVIVEDTARHCVRCGAALSTPESRMDLDETAAINRRRSRWVSAACFIAGAGIATSFVILIFQGSFVQILTSFLTGVASGAFIRYVYSGYFTGALTVAIPQLIFVGFNPFVLLGHLCIGAALDLGKTWAKDG